MGIKFNRVELIGRLGGDPELRYTPEGQTVAKFSLATDRIVKTGAPPETDWHQVVCWGKLAEFTAQYLAKGRLIFAAGRLTYRTWEGNDGKMRRATEVVAKEIIALDRRTDGEAREPHDTEEESLPF